MNKNNIKYKIKLLFARATETETEVKPSKAAIFCEQLINSLIVAGISGISAYIAAGENAVAKIFAVAFGLTFLTELRKYRKI